MLDEWTGNVIGQMHIHQISMQEMAAEMGWNRVYLSSVLNCHRKPKNAERDCFDALERLVRKRSG